MTDSAQPRASRLALRSLLLLLGAGHVALGAFMALAPRSFFDEIAAYGPFNDHYVRDLATFYLALGAIQVVAAGRRTWRVPILTLTVLQYALHALNHIWDVADSDPSWIGPVNLAAIALLTVLGAWLLRLAQRER